MTEEKKVKDTLESGVDAAKDVAETFKNVDVTKEVAKSKEKLSAFSDKVMAEANSVDPNNLDINTLKEKKYLLAAVAGGVIVLFILFSMLFGGGFDPEGTYSGPRDSSIVITSDEVVLNDGSGNAKPLEYTNISPIDIEGFEYTYEFTMGDGTKVHLAQHESGKYTLGQLSRSGKLRGMKFTKD